MGPFIATRIEHGSLIRRFEHERKYKAIGTIFDDSNVGLNARLRFVKRNRQSDWGRKRRTCAPDAGTARGKSTDQRQTSRYEYAPFRQAIAIVHFGHFCLSMTSP